jgi:site-specific recombinase XerD
VGKRGSSRSPLRGREGVHELDRLGLQASLVEVEKTLHGIRPGQTTAVSLLEAGVDRSVIALWLGHESVETTQMYLDADLAMKERALARTAPPRVGPGRFQPRDSLLVFLEGL